MAVEAITAQDQRVVAPCDSISTFDPRMPNNPAYRVPTPPCSERGVRALRPLPRLLHRLGLELERPPARLPDCELRHYPPGTLICEVFAPRRESFVVCHGLVLRCDPLLGVRPATALAGPNEGLALYGSCVTRHTETLTAATAVEVAAIRTSELCACEAREGLLSRLVAGPQSIASIRHWARFGWIADADGAERVSRALISLVQRLGSESELLTDLRLDVDALARWLAMPVSEAVSALARLQTLGLVALRDGVLRSIDPQSLCEHAGGLKP